MRRVAVSSVALALAALAAMPSGADAQGAGTYLVASLEKDWHESQPNVQVGQPRQNARADGWRIFTDGDADVLYGPTYCNGNLRTPSTNSYSLGQTQSCGTASIDYGWNLEGNTGWPTEQANTHCPFAHPPKFDRAIGFEYSFQQSFSQVTIQLAAKHLWCAFGDGLQWTVDYDSSNIVNVNPLACGGISATHSTSTYTANNVQPNTLLRSTFDRRGDYVNDAAVSQILIFASCSEPCTSQYCVMEYERSCNLGATPPYAIDQCTSGTQPPDVATPAPTTTTTTTTTTAAPTPACNCDAEKLEAVYSSDAIPDATADAISNISLDTDTWEVVFEVRNVRAIKNGHVIAAAVNTQETAANAFTPLVSAFAANDLWNPLECGLGGIDTPATNLKVRTEWDDAACRTKYEMRYSLIDASVRDDTYCDLTDDNAGNIKVNCSIVLSSVRAYSSTETWAFTAQEAAFAAELNLGTYLNNEVTDLLHATMAKCSVKNGPLYVVDCRVPGVWNFDQSAFTVAQSPAGWINAASCASNVVGSDAATAATFIRCNIENDAPIANVQRALANITGTPVGNPTNALTFDVDFIVPRKVTTTASASLASFVQTIEMKDGKYYYGTADVATLEITVVDTARLSMTALELFNSATPSAQVYDIFPGTSDARFQTALNADATKFTIDFYPAAVREDSAFYRFGPHGINVSFTFSAARRVTGGGTGGAGNVLVEGLNVEGTEATTSSSAQGSAASSSSGTALMAGVAVGAAVLVAGLVGAAVVAVKRRNAAEEQKEQL